ncbi:cytochrome b5 domain-containing protein 1 [Ischnura elegans]|uniref:cytochrome b5 domain-containing protein 1 n=1 Tax=Ischnura elegans TaxID=197161 RepID=UPI001ED867D8|nr:cytochrome b5 domain-containing protein 1 [Ischnura elegans]XP_046389610.1 cytochrome b5 domain-containing protein 1 [Ischnura elegans]XP_046389611.1 cytochrome b5 domain-containing protein 1 [Ischnura elegans]XP_046389612.1 cytochrome b5 domain-containing protein 1 [Ischnura elegans]XP_046389613.1 cytochrome b5 domain-containing protein 1 [Ischnura elegans]XP_046389614.1 cytochrome b5 domain-containing protein 1 [Ischnura elegans]
MNQGGNRDMKTFTPSDVVIHNQPCDLWVSYLGNVYNLTPLIVEFTNIGAVKLIKPLLAFGGKDISEWFNPDTGELRTYTHPITWTTAPYTPHGTLPHLGPLMPTSLWKPLTKKPWWKDTRYMIGRLTAKARPIRILNVLTGHDDQIEVCCEDTLNRIQERYLFLNNHSGSYTWKFEGRVLNMNLTLAENGIPDEREEFIELLLPEKFYIPAIMIYNNDDLTSS